MQPLFQASGWSLPNTIVTETKNKKNKANTNTDVPTKEVSKEADQLQAQFNQLNPSKTKNKGKKQNKRNRQEDEELEENNGTKILNNTSISKKQKLNKGQQQEKKMGNKPVDMQQDHKVESVLVEKNVQKQKGKQQKQQQQQGKKQEQQQQEGDQQKKKKKKNKKNKASNSNEDTKTIPPSTNNVQNKNQSKDNTKSVESNDNNKNNDKKKNSLDENKKNKLKALLEKQKKTSSDDQSQPREVNNKQNTKASTKVSNAPPEKGLTALQQKMKDKLSGARFRWLNEKLYTTEGTEAYTLFQDQPELFDEYHEGFRHQVESWPENPVDIILDQLRETPDDTIIADLGCGDAVIGHTLTKQKVLSFDLIAKNDKVIACDITKLPLPANFVDIAVFSLSLMGTNYFDFLKEAHRILKPGAELKIAEVISRFSDIDGFIDLVERIGFDFIEKDDGNKMFVMLYFTKKEDLLSLDDDEEMFKGLTKNQKKQLQKGAGVRVNTGALKKQSHKLLKPCLYKRR